LKSFWQRMRISSALRRDSATRKPSGRSEEKATLRITCTWPLFLILVLGGRFLAAPQAGSHDFAEQDRIVTRLSRTLGEHQKSVGDGVCQSCHEETFKTFLKTRHRSTSHLPDEISIAGKFSEGKNRMKTLNPELSFRMDEKDGHFYQTAILAKPSRTALRTEQFDIVVGSGRKGQTYLYWKNDRLYELPVSYWTELGRWVNSPGYVDGSADFDRPITPRCVECHATYFEALGPLPADNRFDKSNFELGISCERCHGSGIEHVRQHGAGSQHPNGEETMAPVGLTRERQLDVCAQCHGGIGEAAAPAFSFVPGERLSDYISLHRPAPDERVDVHGNQVALLERSLCFQSSPAMTCSFCHDPHSPERSAASYSDRCIACHQPQKCGLYAKLGPQIAANCVDCHMPVQASSSLVFDDDEIRAAARVRNHWIRVYPEEKGEPRKQ